MPEAEAASLPAFALTPMPSRAMITPAMLAEWGEIFGASPRTIRRYFDRGEKSGDPCPLNDPARMLEWWPKHFTWRVPDGVLAAAARSVEGSKPKEAAPPADPIELGNYDLAEGSAVLQARQLVAVAYEQLKDAYAGRRSDLDSLQRKWEKAVESLRKAESADRESAKLRGAWLSRVEIQRDLATALEMLRQMRESMPRRILELVTGLDAVSRERLTVAILRVREQEEGIFRMMPTLKGLDDVSASLAA